MSNLLPLMSTWDHPCFLVASMLLVFSVFCVALRCVVFCLYFVCFRPVSFVPNVTSVSGLIVNS